MVEGRCRVAAILALAAALGGCDPAVEPTGERWVYSNDDVDVALVQVFEQSEPDSMRLRHAVLCRTEATARRWREERGELWPGWALVGYLPDVDHASPLARAQKAALEAASGAARERLVAGGDWLAWKAATHIDFTFDDCVTWSRFDLADSLPASDLDAKQLSAPMTVANLQVDEPRIAFTVYSPALTYTGRRHVESRDGGRTWRVVR